ncbi:hypothetical protein [Maribacter aestuarii]|uniref:hypothetical protein n=1 Tax=Maribacter aestuarii TaxID=1130723 RepID=UPI00248C6717|nr:hypothetical protein [Maribacter aestuarii]
MNRSRKIASRQFIIALGFFIATFAALGQKQTKTFKESFTVAEDAVLDINTSYADIEFETWNKDVVEITATVTLEGASEEEANSYFNNDPIEILGNSKKIEITSRSRSRGLFNHGDFDFDFGDYDIEIPEVSSFVMEMPEIAPFPEIAEMPPLPMTKGFQFDYEAYKKDGEKYMKKWQKDFEKSFDKEYQKRLEEWGERMEKRAEELEKRLEEREQKQAEMMEKREEMMEKRVAERAEQRARMAEVRARARVTRDSARALFYQRDSLRTAPNIFYFSTDGESKNYKIKKMIKIKMPKSTRLKMNVRHGEVKLAENTRNLNATLSHSSLWATTIEGNQTNVSASYSPVKVQKWNYGQLQTKYSKDVSLAEVLDLQLRATSSDVTIDKLLKKAFIRNDFGPLKISSIGNDFEEMDVSLKNAELTFELPSVATAIYVKGNSSELSTPVGLKLNQTKNGSTMVHKGFHLKSGSNRSIVITADYSDVVVQ